MTKQRKSSEASARPGNRWMVSGALCLWMSLWTAPALHASVAESIPVLISPDGTSRMVLSATAGATARYMLVLGSLAQRSEAQRVRVECQVLGECRPLEITRDDSTPSVGWRNRIAQDRDVLARARQLQDDERSTYSTLKIPQTKSFHLFVGETELHRTDQYVHLLAKLARVGRHCTVYVDPASSVSEELLDDVVNTFDERVFPSSRETFGRHRDVDRDGKFAILLTDWLGRLSGGKVSLSGFVRGADFYRDVDAPFSNRCDMMYLNANMKPGAHLRTVLAHEYTHAITFSEHTFGEYLGDAQGCDEEAWLSEAVAHLAENIHGEGWSNLDYRISTYLSDTGRYRLVVPDYFHDGLWRCHGSRGATYLFLKHCVDRHGPSILGDLTRTNLRGIANLETTTGKPFAELFRDWSVSTACAAWNGTGANDSQGGLVMGRLGDRLLAGARPLELMPGLQEVSLAPTSWQACLIEVGRGHSQIVSLAGTPSMDLQATLIPLSPVASQADIALLPDTQREQVSMVLMSNQPVQWHTVSWERLHLRQESAKENEKLARIVPASSLVRTESAKDGVHLGPIDIAEFHGDPIVVKAYGEDSAHRPVVAWSLLAPGNGGASDSPSVVGN